MARSAALTAYLVASRAAGLVAPMILRRRLARGKEDPQRLGERLGHPGQPRPDGPLIWMHGASIGEAMSMQPLIRALLAEPELSVLVTTGTVTSAQRMAGVLPDRATHQFVPVDTAGAVRRFLTHWHPDLAIWVESELWPALIHRTARSGIPMALVNARISARSAARWQRAPRMARGLLGAFDMIRAQDAETVQRLSDLGVSAETGGNLKALTQAPPVDRTVLEAALAALAGRRVWLAASTHAEDEDEVISAIKALPTDVLCILAPRHPDRRADIAARLDTAGLSHVARSDGAVPVQETRVWLADTLGEMGLWYSLAPVALLGGAFGDQGGHSPFEAIQHDCPLMHGTRTANFGPVYAALGQASATVPLHEGALAAHVSDLLEHPGRRAELATRARMVHAGLKPDLDSLKADLMGLMERRS